MCSRLKIWIFVIEGIASLATTYYGNYVYFLFRDEYGLGNLGNLSVAALRGLLGSLAAWQEGRFAQRRGYFSALQVGFGGMALSLLVGSTVSDFAIQLMVLGGFVGSACFIWPALQALVSEGESPSSLPRMLGIYNLIWGGFQRFRFFVVAHCSITLGPKASSGCLPASFFFSC